MKKIMKIKAQISDTAIQMYQGGFWKSLSEENFISIKTAGGNEVYVRAFCKSSDYTGIGVYEKPVDYALSDTINNDDSDYIAPLSFFQSGFIGLFTEENKKPSLQFRQFINGYIYDVTEIKDAEFLLDVMEYLNDAFELYDEKLYKYGFTVNITSNGNILLSQPKYDFSDFRDSLFVEFHESDFLKNLKAMPSEKGFKIFLETLVPPFILPTDDGMGAYFPSVCYAVAPETHKILKTEGIVQDTPLAYQYADFIFYLSEEFGKPSEIIFCNPHYEILLSDFCEKVGIKLTFSTNLAQFVNEDVISELAEMISAYHDGMEIDDETEYSDEPLTYKISVSVGTGCYRHIEMSANDTLEDLHYAIQNAFNFDNDHAYAFFMDGRAWSNASYYCEGIDENQPLASEHTLFEVLEEKRPFLYLFDFGDEWRFQCKLLSVKNKECKETKIVKSVGKSPEQYPAYDDDDYDDF